jgi:phosphate starvation-inducible PhoH-like protein
MANLSDTTIELEFDNNRLLPQLFGDRDRFIKQIEKELQVSIIARGNRVIITGAPKSAAVAHTVLDHLYERLSKGLVVSNAEVDAALRMAYSLEPHQTEAVPSSIVEVAIPTRRRVVSARSPMQAEYIQALQEKDLVFGIGPAGTGKTYLAVATAVSMLFSGKVNRIILSRPAVEAGERLGFLPGDLREKVDPYLRPLYDALFDMIPSEQVAKRFSSGEIEVAPLAFMRGRTLSKSFVILDEAQNTTSVQMKMFLTRLGEGAKMVVTGDLTQIDLPPGINSGLQEALDVLEPVPEIAFKLFTKKDVIRHPIVTKIVEAYEKNEKKKVSRK